MERLTQASLFTEKSGRLEISARLLSMGDDPLILLYGGVAHLGALVLADETGRLCHCSSEGHKDSGPALDMARRISSATGKRTGVCCGIHYDRLTGAELNTVLELCGKLTKKIIAALSTQQTCQERPMLDIKELDKFAEYIKSGALEEKFKVSGEETRHQILELLERLMEVSDLADECATRLIFRSSPASTPEPRP